eukprot:TRINITY_DN7231_c2_g1_i1.p1 TRINITY_DN7231_c2_g1~~TRINITY_DN7231_c2_g1_i1.p1  ORF type:complete len:447 (+),score=110.00 TRINITY_DN7231_c2_g1_i1:74-1342(+)
MQGAAIGGGDAAQVAAAVHGILSGLATGAGDLAPAHAALMRMSAVAPRGAPTELGLGAGDYGWLAPLLVQLLMQDRGGGARIPGLSEAEMGALAAAVAAEATPRVFPSGAGPDWDALPPPAGRVSCGCPVLDRLMGGGAAEGEATELAGVAGAGKTQMVMQWSFAACCAGRSSAVIIALEPLPMQRVAELAEIAARSRPADFPRGGSDALGCLEISTSQPGGSRWGHLRQSIRGLPRLLERQRAKGCPVRLVAVDSVAVACQELGADAAARAQQALRAAGELRRICDQHHCALLLVNHVVANFSGDEEAALGDTPPDRVPSVRPALGLAWASFPTTRLVLLRGHLIAPSDEDGVEQQQQQQQGPRRLLRLESSPVAPRAQCHYEISRDGVRGLGGTEQLVTADLLYDADSLARLGLRPVPAP